MNLRRAVFIALAAAAALAAVWQKTQDLRTWCQPRGSLEPLPEEWAQIHFAAQYAFFLEAEATSTGQATQTAEAAWNRLRQELERFEGSQKERAVSPRQSRRLGILWAHLGERDRASRWFSQALTHLPSPQRASEEALWRALAGSGPASLHLQKKAPELVAKMDLGWYGDLALADLYGRAGQRARAQGYRETARRQCRRAVVTVLGLLGGIGLGTAIGLVLGVLFGALYATGQVRPIGLPSPRPAILLGETFVLYLFLAEAVAPLVLAAGGKFLLPDGPASLIRATPLLSASMGVAALSLLWPASQIRAARSSQAIPDSPQGLGAVLGWRTTHLGKDLLWGMGGYLAMLPLLGAALVILTLILRLGGPHLPNPTHPLVTLFAAEPTPLAVALFAVLGSILAPLLEETLFRGALYSALRQRWGVGTSVALSSTLFALLHPQLPLGFLPLFILGAGFALLYEIRGSLIPSIVAHALTNGVTLGFLYGLVGS